MPPFHARGFIEHGCAFDRGWITVVTIWLIHGIHNVARGKHQEISLFTSQRAVAQPQERDEIDEGGSQRL